VGGREACQKLFDEVIALQFSDPTYSSANRTAVDCYCLQHPVAYCASFKSFAAHLTGLCCAMTHDADPEMMRAVHMGLDTRQDRSRPPFVERRGELTIDSVHRTADAAGHHAAVRAWANSLWDAWAEYHELAEQLLREAVEAVRSRKRARG
jgi:hypothetical protein